MSRLLSLFFGLLLSASGVAAEARTPAPAPIPSISSEQEKCYLSVVDGLVKACCDKTGEYRAGLVNCTNFAYNFDKLCSESLGPENCFFVSVSCPHNPVGHRLNMVRLGDGRFYVVEPQGEIYYDHPLPSPHIPDALLCKIIQGCGCSADVRSYTMEPNTWDMCAYNDALLVDVYPKRPGPEMLRRCRACCDEALIPPRYPDPEGFRRWCKIQCDFEYDPEQGAAKDLFDRYCHHRYVGRQCKMCCAFLGEGKKCEDSCEEGHGRPLFIEIPEKEPNHCRGKNSDASACHECCRQHYSLCTGVESMPCVGWVMQCIQACDVPQTMPVSSASPSPPPKK